MKTNSQIIKDMKEMLALYKAKASAIENILSAHKPTVVPKYSMSILVNGVGITYRFSEDDVYSKENDLAKLLVKAGVPELDEESAYAEFSSATLSYLIGEMKSSYMELSGEDIRYYTKNKKAWKYLSSDVVIEVHKLPESNEDWEVARNKAESKVVEDLISSGIIAELEE